MHAEAKSGGGQALCAAHGGSLKQAFWRRQLKAKGKASDIEQVLICIHLYMAKHGIRCWFEWVDSAANPSDGLSRLGCFQTLISGTDFTNGRPFRAPTISSRLDCRSSSGGRPATGVSLGGGFTNPTARGGALLARAASRGFVIELDG